MWPAGCSFPTPGLDILRQSCELAFAAFASASTMLPNGLVQLFSENILEVPDTLDQHNLQSKNECLITKLFLDIPWHEA